MTVTKWVLLFYVYCFAGWIWETCYVSVRAGRFCNRNTNITKFHLPVRPTKPSPITDIIYIFT